MPVVKKLKFDIDGDGIQTTIKVSINAEGKFYADVPLHVKMITQDAVSGCTSMKEAVDKVHHLIFEYQNAVETTSRVILIDFKRQRTPFLNEGISMSFNYIVANKVQLGKKITYKVLCKESDGKYRQPGNDVPTTSHWNGEGVIAGKSLELEYTEERMQTIEYIHENLEVLCQKLYLICNSENTFVEFINSTVKMLESGFSSISSANDNNG